MSNREPFKYCTILIVVLWLTAFVLLPNLGVLLISVLKREETTLIEFSLTLSNYEKLFSPMYIEVFSKTFIVASYVTIISLLFSYPFVYVISQVIKNKKIKDFLLILVVIPFWTSSLTRAYAIMIILRINGLVNNTLLALGITDQPIEFLYTKFAVIIGFVYSSLPFMILPLYAAFEKLDRNYINAAQDLGAGKGMVIFKIIIPLTKSGITAGCALVFLSTLGTFFIPELLGGSKEILIGNLIKNQFLIIRDWPLGAAISSVLIVFIIALIAISKVQKGNNRVII